MITKLKVHSFVDLITNSSTEIYIDYSNSVIPCKAMIDEMFKACGVNKTCDEVFDITIENEDDECTPATIIVSTKDDAYERLGDLVKEFLESGEEKEFLS